MTDRISRSWRNPWVRGSLLFVGMLTLGSLAIGFVWLPSVQSDFTAQGIWSSICRAAGAPGRWAGRQDAPIAGVRTTAVVLSRSMSRSGNEELVGLGATVALQCTTCHGARGISGTDAPNLAGQYREVIVKQLADYKANDRTSAVMQAFALHLSPSDVEEVAAYYAYLPKSSPAIETGGEAPALVRAGDPMRNIAPCASCHGGADHKLGAPWLAGMPEHYLTTQLAAFAAGTRTNDSHAQMRNMARRLTGPEIAQLAAYYARS